MPRCPAPTSTQTPDRFTPALPPRRLARVQGAHALAQRQFEVGSQLLVVDGLCCQAQEQQQVDLDDTYMVTDRCKLRGCPCLLSGPSGRMYIYDGLVVANAVERADAYCACLCELRYTIMCTKHGSEVRQPNIGIGTPVM